MIYEVEVRPGPHTEFFQYYTETVEAPTSHDAELRVQRANPGCIVRVTDYWSECDDVNSGDNESGSSMDGGFILAVALIVFLVYAWKWILLIGGIGLIIWIAMRYLRD